MRNSPHTEVEVEDPKEKEENVKHLADETIFLGIIFLIR
jgi:hypothetical protein